MPEYLVVSRAQSGVRFPKDAPLILEQFPTELGRVDIIIQTRLALLAGISKPVPMGLMAEVRGSAPSLDDAVQEFSRAVQSLCPVFSFIGNSTIEDMVPEIGYEVTPGVTDRDFFQQFLAEERLLIIERRRIPTDLAIRILDKFLHHAEAERIRRALAQYYQALRNWEPGQEVLAVAHLWMGIEALTPVVVRRFALEQQTDRPGIARLWQVDEKLVEAEARRLLIMHGDSDAYSTARKASDGFEHGYLGFLELRKHADQVRLKVAQYLRAAIINELALDKSDAAALLAPPFDVPGHLGLAKYLRGKLIAPTEEIAAPDQAHPFLKWTTKFTEVQENNEDVKVKMEETITGVFAKGVQFQPRRVEVWGGQESTLKRDGV